MKYTLHYCVLLLMVATTLQAQKTKLKMQRITNPCDNEEITYQYNKEGLLTEQISKIKGFNGQTVVNKTAYKYNDKGKNTAVYYLCNDTLVSDEQSEYIGNDLVHFRRTVKGKLELDEAYIYKKGDVMSITSTTPGGVVVQTMIYDKAHGYKETTTKSGNVITAVEKEYKKGNSLTIEHHTPPFKGKPEVVKEYVYDYDGNVIDDRTFINGLETKRIISRFDRNIPASRKEYFNGVAQTEVLYDEHGNLLKEEQLDTGEVKLYDSKFNSNRDLREVKVMENNNVKCTKTYVNEYW